MRIALTAVLLLVAFPPAGMACIENPRAKGVVHGVVLRENGEPAVNFTAVLDPLGVSLSYLLPQMKTNERGEFRFEHLCPGRFSVDVENDEEGYSPISSAWYRILYGRPIPEVRITKSKFDAQLLVTIPPKPGRLRVNLVNRNTKEKIADTEIELIVDRTRIAKTYCDTAKFMTYDSSPYFMVPPDQDVFLHVTSPGFREWKESAGRGKLIHVGYGDLLTLDVELDPIQN